MGYIGKTKFCVATNCTIAKHESIKFDPKPGLYIRVPKRWDQCFCTHFLPDGLFESDLSSEFLSTEKPVDTWTSIFAAIASQGTTMGRTDWENYNKLRQKVKSFNTPRKPPKPPSDAATKLASIVNELKHIKNEDVEQFDSDDFENRISRLEKQVETLAERLEAWALDAQFKDMENEEDKESLASKLFDLETTIGSVPPDIASEAEPSIWETISSLFKSVSDMDNLEATNSWKKLLKEFRGLHTQVHSDKRSNDEFVQSLVSLCTQFRNDIMHLNNRLKVLQGDFNTFSNSNHTSNLFGSIADPNYMDIADLNDNYKELYKKFEQLTEFVKAFVGGGDKPPDGVEIGNLKFSTRDDLKVWVLDNTEILEGGEREPFPFGVFLDVYSFLARIQTYGDSKDTMLKNLDLNQRTKLTSDEVTTLVAFTNMIPSIFGRASGNSALSSTKTTFLPAMREKEDWETNSREGGIKRIIEDQIKNVLSQMRDLISARLHGKTEAIMLATTCLSVSQAFVIDLSRFISDTYNDLSLSGFPTKASWLLVTKLVVRIFGTDLDRVRAFMRGKMDTFDHTQLATDSL